MAGGIAERMARGLPKRLPIAGVKQVVAIASGKGGVGKSTVAVNLAVATALRQRTKLVGLLDADIYGPSIPKMMNLSGRPEADSKGWMKPLVNFGVKCMSIGFLVDEEQPVVWRGLLIQKALETMLRKVVWGPLDYLFVDMPPGTGDVQLSLTQNVPVDGAVIVTTAQEIALIDARKGAEMFRRVDPPVNVLGLVENMAHFTCPTCGTKSRIFGAEDVALNAMASDTHLDIIGRVPLERELVPACDRGAPIVVSSPASPAAEAFFALSAEVLRRLPEWHDPKNAR